MSDPDPTTVNPRPEFSRTATGENGQAIQLGTDGSLATNNYPFGGGFDFDGAAYPYEIDASAESIALFQEIYLTESADIEMELLLDVGDTITIPLAGSIGSWDGFEVETITFRDPNNTAARVAGGWAGES